MSSEVNPGGGAAEHVGSVKDLMVEILVRVPAKSVTRFKLVSKGLCSLISDPEFVESHAQVNNYPSGMFLYTSILSHETDFFWLSETKTNQPSPSLTFLDGVFGDGFKVWILRSCSGLLLCRYSIDVGRYDRSPDNLLVCNPSTKQYRKIPPPENVSGGSGWRGSDLYFAYDPSVLPHYKLVCVRSQIVSNQSIYLIEVYSSHNHRWRLLLESNELNMVVGSDNIQRYSNWRPLNLNSELFHFDLKSEALVRLRELRPIPDRDISVNYSKSISMISKEYPCLVCVSNWRPLNLNSELFHFDLKSEALVRLRELRPIPDRDISVNYSKSISMISKEYPCLVCVSLCYTMEDSSISILEMSQDFREWVAKYRVNLCELTSAYPEILEIGKRDRLELRHIRSVCPEIFGTGECDELGEKLEAYKFQVIRVVQGFHSKGEPELVLAIPGKIISYNFVKKTVKTLHNLPNFESTSAIYDTAFQYTESLSSV